MSHLIVSQPPIDVSQIVAKSFRIYILRWRPHIAAAAVAQLPAVVPTLVLVSLLLEAALDVLATRSIDALVPAATLSLVLLGVSFLSAFLFVLMSGAACQLVTYWLDGVDVTLLRAYAVAVRRFWRLAGALLGAFALILGALVALGAFLALMYIGFVALLPKELWSDERIYWFMLVPSAVAAVAGCIVLLDALVRWAVFVQAVIIENRGPLEALARSAELVRRNWWRTAGAMGLLIIVPMVLMVVAATLLNVLFLPLARVGVAPELINAAGIAAAQVTLSPVPAIGVTVLFYRLRDGASIWQRIDARAGMVAERK